MMEKYDMDLVTLFVGKTFFWLGCLGEIEMLATACEKWAEHKRLSRPVRIELYFVALFAFCLIQLRTALFSPF